MRLIVRLISVILIAGILCTTFAFAADTADEPAQKNSVETAVPEQVKVLLTALELMTDKEMKSAEYVTRGFAAKAVLRLSQADADIPATGNVYSDVSADDTYAYAIEYITKCKFAFGTGNGRFEPNRNITLQEMNTILLRFAGYDEKNVDTTYKNDLLKNVDASTYVTHSALAQMIYNTLYLKVIYIDKFGDGNITYKISDDITILNDSFKVYEKSGVVTENGVTGLWSGSDLREDEISLKSNAENFIMNIGATDINNMIGRHLKIYYKDIESGETPVCLGYYLSYSQNNITEISLFDINYRSTTESKLFYLPEDNSKEKFIKYGVGTAILYNGTYYADSNFNIKDLDGLEGKIIAIDNNDDSMFDVLEITAYKTYVVNSVILSSGEVFSKNREDTIVLGKNQFDIMNIFYSNGKAAYIEDFNVGTVLAVAENSKLADKRVVNVIVSEDTVSGTVTSISKEDGNKTIITLDNDKEYIICDNKIEIPKISQGVTFRLTAQGNVGWIEYHYSGAFMFGVITRVIIDEKLFDDCVKIKMIASDNTIKQYSLTKKTIIDGDKAKDINGLYDALTGIDKVTAGSYSFPQNVYPVRYRLSSDNQIIEIDTPKRGANESVNTLTLVSTGNHLLQYDMVLGASVVVEKNTPVFKITANPGSGNNIDSKWFDDTAYTSMTTVGSSMTTGNTYQNAAYKVNNDSFYADFVIEFSTYGQSYSDMLFLVDSIYNAYDEITEICTKKIKGIQSGAEKEVFVSDEYLDTFDNIGLKSGDLIRYKTNSYGHLIKIEGDKPLLKHDTTTIRLENVSGGKTSIDDFKQWSNSVQIIFGYVLEREGNIVKVAYIPPSTTIDGNRRASDFTRSPLIIKIPASVPIAVFDPTKRDTVFPATYDEILDYKRRGNECSLVAMHFRSAQLRSVMVFNDSSMY